MLVHGGNTNHYHIRALAAMQFLAIVMQVDREIGAHAGGMNLPEVAIIEESLMMELILQLRIGMDFILRSPAVHLSLIHISLKHIAGSTGILSDYNLCLVVLAIIPAQKTAHMKRMIHCQCHIRFAPEPICSKIL